MHRFESHNFGFRRVAFLQKLSQMANVVVAENEFLRTAVPDTLYHWGVIARVRVDLTTYTTRGGGKVEELRIGI